MFISIKVGFYLLKGFKFKKMKIVKKENIKFYNFLIKFYFIFIDCEDWELNEKIISVDEDEDFNLSFEERDMW